MDNLSLSKNELIDSHKSDDHSSSLVSEAWNWAKENPVKFAIGAVGATALADLGLIAATRFFASKAESEVLGFTDKAISGGLQTASESISVPAAEAELGNAGQAVTADLENVLDVEAFSQGGKMPIYKLPKDFDPKQALRERAALIAKFGSGELEHAPELQISWGEAKTTQWVPYITAALKKLILPN